MLLKDNMQKKYKSSREVLKQVKRMGGEINFPNNQEKSVDKKKLSIEELINNAKIKE